MLSWHASLPTNLSVCRSFFLSRVHTKRTEVLPRAAAARVASLGELDVHTGDFIVKPTVTTILSEYEVWSDFNYD